MDVVQHGHQLQGMAAQIGQNRAYAAEPQLSRLDRLEAKLAEAASFASDIENFVHRLLATGFSGQTEQMPKPAPIGKLNEIEDSINRLTGRLSAICADLHGVA